MDENEIMTAEQVINEVPEVINEKTGMSTGAAMLIGGVIAGGLIVGGKMLMSMWKKRKAMKEITVIRGSEEPEAEDPE